MNDVLALDTQGGRAKFLNVAVGWGKGSKNRMFAGIAKVILTIDSNLSVAINVTATFLP